MQRRALLALVGLSLASAAMAQSEPKPAAPPAATEAKARHLVMFTRAGPNFARVADHRAEAIAHQQLYQRLAKEGHSVAGGSFEGQPVLGMTIWRQGIDEAAARALIAEDQLPTLGIVEYEFRTLVVRMGALK